MLRPDGFNPPKSEGAGSSIVFFDGVCGLCNHVVQFVLHRDINHQFLFSPLQGKTFKGIGNGQNADSIFVLRRSAAGEDLLSRSDAALFILSQLPRYRLLSQVGSLFPHLIRDAVYRLVAAIRYQVWGRTACAVPSPEEASRFLP